MRASGKDAHAGWRKGLLRHALPLFLVFLPVRSAGQSPVSSHGDTITVDVNLVVLHATVRDRKGNLVAGLQKENFRVFEDGHLQTIRLFQHEDAPVAAGLIVDNSASMYRKRRNVTAAALAFARSSNVQDQMFVVNFNERPSLGLPFWERFTADPAEIEAALNGTPARGMTALYDAIDTGIAHLQPASREGKVLVVISDGGDNASHHTLPQVLEELACSNIIVYTVGLFDEFDADRNPSVLKTIARTTGGDVFLPEELSEMVPISERIAKELRSRYTIGYAPSRQALDHTFRTIKVTAHDSRGKKLSVRTRDGYMASPKPEHER